MIEHKEIQAYADRMTSEEPANLKELERETNLKTIYPRMLSGKLQGRFLSMLVRMLKPKRILEVGTFTGYAALCMAEGLDENGIVVTLEKNEELKPILEKALNASPFGKKVRVLWGDALKNINTLEGSFDLVFIDADKISYLNYYESSLALLNAGGFIIADNVLWSGKVLDEEEQDPDTKALRKFNEEVKKDERVEQVLLPVRDGLLIIRKK